MVVFSWIWYKLVTSLRFYIGIPNLTLSEFLISNENLLLDHGRQINKEQKKIYYIFYLFRLVKDTYE